MSSSHSMYKISQIVRHDLPVLLPDCMYKISNIHSGSSKNGNRPDITQQVKQFLKNTADLPEMAELQLKQEQILKQLEDLKRQMIGIRDDLKQTGVTCSVQQGNPTKQTTQTRTTQCTRIYVKDVPDLVVNVNPLNPPYSLLLLKKLWANNVDLSIQTHLHSTVPSLPKAAQQFCDALNSTNTNISVSQIRLKLIWKDIGANQLELYISSKPILGECNFLRYLARVTGSLNYDESNYEMDNILDKCYSIARSKTNTEKNQLLQSLNQQLGKSPFLFGNGISVADVAAYSAIKQSCNDGQINVNMTKWIKSCESF